MINLAVEVWQFVRGLVPVKIRGAKMRAWIIALLRPLQTLNGVFAAWGNAVLYEQRFNAQVLYLEHVLNDVFNEIERQIYIDDAAVYIDENYIYNQAEPEQTLILYNEDESQPELFLYNASEVYANSDFVVYVPDTITFDALVEAQMRKIIERYRLAGKRYTFEIYTV
jgi:hypothetical protein